jgi:hypothetical protein
MKAVVICEAYSNFSENWLFHYLCIPNWFANVVLKKAASKITSNRDTLHLLTENVLCFSVDTIFLVSHLIEQNVGIAVIAETTQTFWFHNTYPNYRLSPPSLALQMYNSMYRTIMYIYLTKNCYFACMVNPCVSVADATKYLVCSSLCISRVPPVASSS